MLTAPSKSESGLPQVVPERHGWKGVSPERLAAFEISINLASACDLCRLPYRTPGSLCVRCMEKLGLGLAPPDKKAGEL